MQLPALTAIIERGEDGWFVATCPELDIVSQGETGAQAEEMLREAVELWLECAEEEEVLERLTKASVSVRVLQLSHA